MPTSRGLKIHKQQESHFIYDMTGNLGVTDRLDSTSPLRVTTGADRMLVRDSWETAVRRTVKQLMS